MQLNISRGIAKLIWLVVTWSSLALGTIGLFLPILPTTPFVLVAAWSAPKCSPGLTRWIYKHPRFKRLILQWQAQGVIPMNAKVLAIGMLLLSWLVLFMRDSAVGVLIFLAVLFSSVSIFIVTRPSQFIKEQP